ncbi:MAG: 4Fe-4S dicluster domain-containing protein, partial [Thermoplasmata archaeon]|nr:4Fe-4S dicluster domain-containing protein [Thermoplasmata archaeon]
VLEPASDGFTLVFGSEGQLGIVTSITLEVDPVSGSARPHLVLFDTVEAALSFAKDVSWGPIRPVHMVYESASKLAMMNQMLSNFSLVSGEAVLVYLDGAESETAFAKFMSTSGLKEEAEYLARYLWGERYFPMKMRRLGPGMLGTEVLIPQKRLPEAVAKTQGLCASLGIDPSFEVHYLPEGGALLLCFFLVNQGNTFGYTVDAFKSLLLTRLLMDHGGAPYSVGVWNQPFTDAEDRAHMKALRRLKSELDPAHVMNAGKMFHLSGRFGKLGGLMLHPRLMRPLLRTVIAFSPLSTMLIERFSEIVRVRYRPKRRTPLLRTADECAMCGACVSVCPAYLIVGDERVTGRGKMLTVKALAAGQRISEEHARLTSLCMRCKACEQVCQSKLSLVDAYEALEAELEEFHGRDPREVERFIRYAETSPEYDRMVQRGLVLGAPDHGPGGEG